MTPVNLVTINGESSRACRACGHAVPHSRGEYEDTHSRCTHFDEVENGCGDHGMWKSGKRKGQHRFSKKCEDENASSASCFTGHNYCECSEEDRRIAELTKALIEIRAALGVVPEWIEIGDTGFAAGRMFEIASDALTATRGETRASA